MNEASTPERELIYVADPMCSWCWGFSPVIAAISRQIEAHTASGPVAMTPIMGGLRPLTRHAMSDEDKATIRHHWDDVAKRSGQPFDVAFFERDGFVYDTEPACRAVAVVRRLTAPRTFAFFERIQRAFYAENTDVTDTEVLANLAAEAAGIVPADFRAAFEDAASYYETAGDFHTARQLGVSGYPTVILRTNRQFALLTQGYQPYDALKPAIEDWLNGTLKTHDMPQGS